VFVLGFDPVSITYTVKDSLVNSAISGPLFNLKTTPKSLEGEITTLTIPPPIIDG
jgi:hypothetical protein